MASTQLFRPNRRYCNQCRGAPQNLPFQHRIDRLAPARLAVIGIIDPKIPEIGDPRDVKSPRETTGNDQARIGGCARENDLGFPFFDQLTAGGNGRPDPIGPHVGDVDQPKIVAAKPLSKRFRRCAALRLRCVPATSGRDGCAAAQPPRQPIDQMLALAILRIEYPFSRDLEWQAPIFGHVGSQHTHVMASMIEIARKLTYADRSDHIGRRERKADDQDLHLGRRSGPDLDLKLPNAPEPKLMAAG